WYFRQVYAFADVLIAISPGVEEAIRKLGVTTRIVRIANPLQIQKWKRTDALRKKGREMFGLKEGDFCVLGVGQLQQRKGPEDFIEIGKRLPHIQFRWIGGRPFGAITEGVSRLNRKIEQAPFNVKFTGLFPLHDMPAAYAGADAFIFLSHQENSPLAPIEAAASGLPVMYRALREYELLYTHRYFNGRTPDEFVQWIAKLASDSAFYWQAAEVSAQLITQLEKEPVRRRLISLYKELGG
ncbi:MAG TPA: glycosyltransferase family 4 protein, partial [Cyclobacteriaceae bacterium]|nr:glycosyltransferase family 4 protein [Cyclobacteriaceae bacterium]